MTVVQTLRQFIRDEEGVTAIEYGLIASLVSVAIVAALLVLGPKLAAVFTDIASHLP